MKTSQELMKKAGILPKLRLGLKHPGGGVNSTGAHRVKVIEDKVVHYPDNEGKDTEWVRYTVEENGERKQYDTRLRKKGGTDLAYLVQRFAEIKEGDEVILEMKKQGVKNYIEVTPVGHSSNVEIPDDEIEVPDDEDDDEEDVEE